LGEQVPLSVHAIVPDLDTARRAVSAGANVLRLAAGPGTRAAIASGQGLRALGTPFYVIDDVEAALELGADGVHLELHPEQRDRARRAGLLVGASTTTLDRAITAQADYLAVDCRGRQLGGRDAPLDWLEELARICAAVAVPVIAAGATEAAAASACIEAGAAGIAVGGVPRDRTLRQAVDAALAARRAQR
jgi:thiamine monophosphate synthase